MEEILHQLRLAVYPIICRVLYISGGCLGFLNHQQYEPCGMGIFMWHSKRIIHWIGGADAEENCILQQWDTGYRIAASNYCEPFRGSKISQHISTWENPQKWRFWVPLVVGGWTNPFEKYARQIGANLPRVRDEQKKYLKPPPSIHIPPWEKDNHLQKWFWMGYVSSQEGTVDIGPKHHELPRTSMIMVSLIETLKKRK